MIEVGVLDWVAQICLVRLTIIFKLVMSTNSLIVVTDDTTKLRRSLLNKDKKHKKIFKQHFPADSEKRFQLHLFGFSRFSRFDARGLACLRSRKKVILN